MRLAIVTTYPTSKAALTEYGYYLVRHFRLRQELTEIILITDKSTEEKAIHFSEEGCKITVRECWNFNHFTGILKISKFLKESKPDAVLLNLQCLQFGDNKIPASLGLLFPCICRCMGIPIISLIHDPLEQVDFENAGFTFKKVIQKVFNFKYSVIMRFVLASDVVAVMMSQYKNVLERKYKARNVALIPHGAFDTPPEPDYHLKKGPKQILAFGKFGTYKKIEILIEAVELLREQAHCDLEIVIAGIDSPNTPGYLEEMKSKYAHVDQLRFVGDVAEEDVSLIFSDSAVVVLPYSSIAGSFGILHEAGYFGKAVVLPDLGDLSVMVKEDGYRAEFFEPESPESLANVLNKILQHDAYRINLGKANYRAACSLPMSKITQMYMDYFELIKITKTKGFSLNIRKPDKSLIGLLS